MNETRTHSNDRSAFTLVEIMVAIAVISIAASLGGGVYLGSYQRLQVEKAARQLYMTARYARLLALERQQSVHLGLDRRQGRFFLITRKEDRSGQSKENVIKDAVCRPVELSESIQLEVVDIKTNVYTQESGNTGDSEDTPSSEQSVTFRPDGTANAALLQIGNTHCHYTVSVCPITAKVTLTKGTADKVPSTTVDLDLDQSS